MPNPVRQAGVIAMKNGRVCLVTSRTGNRWVVPKGHIDPGHTAVEAAVLEAWEEAGLTGPVDPAPVGTFAYPKDGADYHVTVYLMPDPDEAATWPEASERTRAWLPAAEAARRVAEPGLRALILAAATRAGVEA